VVRFGAVRDEDVTAVPAVFFRQRDMLGKAHRGSREAGGAFTLVELLVAISIIALLLAVLLPSLSSARARAQQTTCAARLRQWGVAFGVYEIDNRGFWPHCDGLDREDPDPSNPDRVPPGAPPWVVANWHGWMDKVPPVLGYKAWRYYGPYEHPGADTFYQCPTAEAIAGKGIYTYKPEKIGFFSYAMNACLELDEATWRPPGGVDWPMPSFLGAARIVCPQRVVLLFDQLLDPRRGFGGETQYRSAGRYAGSYPIAFAARHAHGREKLGGNLLYCDGHVGWRATVWKDSWGPWDVEHQQGPPRDDPNWYPYPVYGAGR